MLALSSPFIQFGLVILIVLIVSVVMRLLKQPLIIGYILAGILAGPVFLNIVENNETMHLFSEMGIAFLLFIVGLHLSPKVIKEVGKVSLVTGLGQIIFTSLVGFLISLALGFSYVVSMYIAIGMTFSSTIIIMKLLSDKDALDELYGKISIGFLLVQDLVAILTLIVISSIASGGQLENILLSVGAKSLLILGLLVPFSLYILPKLNNFIAKSQEFLFLFAISWGFGLSIIFLYAGFSIEVGALIAGILLSTSPYCYQISSKLKPLRDFFIISFFIILGSQMTFGEIQELIIPASILSAFVLIGNPLIVIILMGLLGYTKKIGFMAGLTVAQISEFSLILIALGFNSGVLPAEILSLVTIVGLITIAGSTYLIIYSDKIFSKISPFLSIFERKQIKEKKLKKEEYDCILIGCDRMGFSIAKTLNKTFKNLLVVDFNPEIVKILHKKGIKAVYGDIDDMEFLEDLQIQKSSLVISTVPEWETNFLLLSYLKGEKMPIVILTSKHVKEARELYDLGTDYVILPHFLSGQRASQLIDLFKTDRKKYHQEKKKELKLIEEVDQ